MSSAQLGVWRFVLLYFKTILFQVPVDPATFVEKTQKLFPDATLSLGWTKQNDFSHLHPKYKRLTWQDLFHILDYVVRLDQPVMLSVRLAVVSNCCFLA